MTSKILIGLVLCAAGVRGASLKAGVARVDITPAGPIWMSGYAARTHPSAGTLTRLWAKALACESAPGGRIVVVTVDVIGLPRSLGGEVAARVERQYRWKRSQLLLNASHTHTGPMVWPNLSNLAVLPPGEREKLADYRRQLADALVTVIGKAIGNLAPATVEYGEGSVAFAVNRRQPAPSGVKLGVNPDGPVDHAVPVLKIADAGGKIRAILFGYACHNTTLTAEIYQLSGDYAGFAAAALENLHPGASALFLMLCGADQNPNPRGTVELARQHGDTLAHEVDRVLAASMTPINGPIRAVFKLTRLRLAPRTRQDFEAELKSPVPAQARRAALILQSLDTGKRIDAIDYPVQACVSGTALQ
jgi:neutral ceramidase